MNTAGCPNDTLQPLKKRSIGRPIHCYIPYRCLVQKNVEKLLVAWRCISCTHEALLISSPQGAGTQLYWALDIYEEKFSGE